ncbi:hypothetical protein ACV1DC_13345 [Aeromonas caviae]
MPPLKAQLLLEESLSAYFPEMVFTDSGITVQLHRNTHIAEHNHSESFRLMSQVMPGWEKTKERLDGMAARLLA